MKKNIFLKHRFINISILILLMGIVLIMSGCNSSNSSIEENDNQVEDEIVHDIDLNPEPLSDSDKVLSLEGYGAIGALNDNDLTITDMLTYAVQDEYLAHGEYLAIIDKFGSQKPYSNIVDSENNHLKYLMDVYSSYGLEFPADNSSEHLVIPNDLLEAAETGVQAEIDNIAMYELFMSYDLPENIYNVFDALKKGSESHLLAFQKQVDKLS